MRRGITLVELILTLGIMAFVMTLSFLWFNPSGQLMNARNNQRTSHLNAILTGIQENKADNRNAWSCGLGAIPTTTTRMASTPGNYNIGPCLVPNFMPNLPNDPAAQGAHFTSISDYDTGYSIMQDASSGIITLTAPFAEGSTTISVH